MSDNDPKPAADPQPAPKPDELKPKPGANQGGLGPRVSDTNGADSPDTD